MNVYAECARAAFSDELTSPTGWKTLMRNILTQPYEASNDDDAIAYITSMNPWGVAHVIDRRKHKIVKVYTGALYKTAMEHK